MAFAIAEIFSGNTVTKIAHDIPSMNKYIPWTITKVSCPCRVGGHNLNKLAWKVSNYNVTESGMEATLDLLLLPPLATLSQDIHLVNLFALTTPPQLTLSLYLEGSGVEPYPLLLNLRK